MSRRGSLLALMRSNPKGATVRQLKEYVGPDWRRVLADVEKRGGVFRTYPSRTRGRGPWKYQLVREPDERQPRPRPAATSPIEQPPLFDAPRLPDAPASALDPAGPAG